MSLNEIKFLVTWAKSNILATKILSSKLSCTENQIQGLLDNLILEIDKNIPEEGITMVKPVFKGSRYKHEK